MSEGHDEIIRLPDDWQEQAAAFEAVGLEPLRVIAARHGVQHGSFSDQCEYVPDPDVWRYYRRMGGTS